VTATRNDKRRRWDLLVLAAGLLVVTAVWLLACWWSFDEQTRAAQALGFRHPAVLPWMLDALAFALALVALAAALNGQSAGTARLGVLIALTGSVWANTQGVSLRFHGHPHDNALTDAVAMAAIAPLSAFIALEVILGRIRRLVLWLRGEEPPAAIPTLRLVRLVLAPKTSFTEWRRAVLTRTAPTPAASGPPVSGAAAGPERSADTSTSPVHLQTGSALTPLGAESQTRGGPAVGSGLPAPQSAAGSPRVADAGRGLSAPPSAPPVRPETASADAPEVVPVVHLVPASDRSANAPRTASATASGGGAGSASGTASATASRRGASAAVTTSGKRRITASADAPETASDVPDPALLDAVKAHLALHSGAYPSGRALAAEMRVHQDKARAAIAHVRAERAAPEVAP
jgi:hypothetical protein